MTTVAQRRYRKIAEDKREEGKRQDKNEREKAERQLEYSSNKKNIVREVSLREAACTGLQICPTKHTSFKI